MRGERRAYPDLGQLGGLKPGTLIGGRYRIEGPLGAGGLGVVYQAEHCSTGQQVAVKLIHPHLDAGRRGAAQARFLRETQLVSQLQHPNLVRLLDAGSLDDGQLYAVFQFVEGEPLSHILSREGSLGLRETLRLMIQVLEALGAAHAKGIVHRDLKPDNIQITSVGLRRSAVVLDFGIAAVIDSARSDSYEVLTREGQTPGTPWYMAPEQFTGTLTPATDLYAWGLVFIECLTGHRAVPSKTPLQAMFWQSTEAPVPIPEVLRGSPLYEILKRVLSKPLVQRYQDSPSLMADLDRCTFQLLSNEQLDISGAAHAQGVGAITIEGEIPTTALNLKTDVVPRDDEFAFATSPGHIPAIDPIASFESTPDEYTNAATVPDLSPVFFQVKPGSSASTFPMKEEGQVYDVTIDDLSLHEVLGLTEPVLEPSMSLPKVKRRPQNPAYSAPLEPSSAKGFSPRKMGITIMLLLVLITGLLAKLLLM